MRIPVFAETKATQTGRHPGRVLRRLLSKMGGWAVSGANPMRKPGGFFNKKPAHPKRIHGQKGRPGLRPRRRLLPLFPCLLFKCGRCSRFPLRPEPDSRRGPGSIAECHRSRGSKTLVSYHAQTISVNRTHFPLIEAEPELCYNTLHDTSHLSHRLVSL